jgi:hypothetical protein
MNTYKGLVGKSQGNVIYETWLWMKLMEYEDVSGQFKYKVDLKRRDSSVKQNHVTGS